MSKSVFCSGGSVSYSCSDFVGCCVAQSCNNTDDPSCLHQLPKPETKYPVNFTKVISPRGNYTNSKSTCGQSGDWGACEIVWYYNLTGCCKSESQNEAISEGYFLISGAEEYTIPAALFQSPSTVSRVNPSSVPENTAGTPQATSWSTMLTSAPTTSSITEHSVPSTSEISLPAATNAGRPAPKSNTAAVAGGIAGGIIGLALLLAVLAIYYRRRPTRTLKKTDHGKLSTWGAGQARAIGGGGGGELDEIKQGPSPTSSLLRPPSSWPLPQPPSYTPYRSHDNELDKSPPNVSQPVASPPHPSNNHPSAESPPSPPPSNTRSSQYSADHESEAESVSPISSHYQRHPFDEEGGVKASVYSDISSSDLFQNQNMRS